MTDHQYDSILTMIRIILDGANDLADAREKFDKFMNTDSYREKQKK